VDAFPVAALFSMSQHQVGGELRQLVLRVRERDPGEVLLRGS